jgi:hypothetical protein
VGGDIEPCFEMISQEELQKMDNIPEYEVENVDELDRTAQ